MSAAPKAVWMLRYEGKDVSDEIAPWVLRITYTDNLHGKADELQIDIEDRDGRWRDGWYPSKNDRLELLMGFEGEPLVPCGAFRVDKVKLKGPPDVVSFRALSVATNGKLRTKTSARYDNTTLRQLGERLARELALTIVGEVGDDPIDGISRDSETTLAFISRIAESYGYAFSIRDSMLVFYRIATLEKSPPALTLDRSDLTDYDLDDGVQGTYAACELTWFDAATKSTVKTIVWAARAREKVVIGNGAGGGTPPPELPTRTLRVPIRGDDVKRWQQFLREKGYYAAEIDGWFYTKTKAATKAFQNDAGITVDGEAGPETFRAALAAGYASTTAGTEATHVETTGDILRINQKVASVVEAEAKARAALEKANRLRVTGTITFYGNPRAVSGANLFLTGMARASGKFAIKVSTHTTTRGGGYSTKVAVNYV